MSAVPATIPGTGPASSTTISCHGGTLRLLPEATAPKNGMNRICRFR